MAEVNDAIHHPKHYCFSEIEPKDAIREWGLNFNLGSAVKYICRAGKKGDAIQDLQKAREFLGFEIDYLSKRASGTAASGSTTESAGIVEMNGKRYMMSSSGKLCEVLLDGTVF